MEEVLGTCDRFVPCNMDDFSPNFDLIEAEMKKGLDCLIVCNPGNPSGRVWTPEEMRRSVSSVQLSSEEINQSKKKKKK